TGCCGAASARLLPKKEDRKPRFFGSSTDATTVSCAGGVFSTNAVGCGAGAAAVAGRGSADAVMAGAAAAATGSGIACCITACAACSAAASPAERGRDGGAEATS